MWQRIFGRLHRGTVTVQISFGLTPLEQQTWQIDFNQSGALPHVVGFIMIRQLQGGAIFKNSIA